MRMPIKMLSTSPASIKKKAVLTADLISRFMEISTEFKNDPDYSMSPSLSTLTSKKRPIAQSSNLNQIMATDLQPFISIEMSELTILVAQSIHLR